MMMGLEYPALDTPRPWAQEDASSSCRAIIISQTEHGPFLLLVRCCVKADLWK